MRKKSEVRSQNVYCDRSCYEKALVSRNRRRHAPRKDYKCHNCGTTFQRLPSQMKGKKYQYCSMACKNAHNSVILGGVRHPRWNPKLTQEDRETRRKYPAYLKWREAVYSRDGYTCQFCGDRQGGNLVAHHILNYSEHPSLRIDIANGITMCENCHKEFHDKYGYTGNDDIQLDEFLRYKIRCLCQHQAKPGGKPRERLETR